MPTPHRPSERPTIKPPICSACGKFMRLAHTEPSLHYTNVDEIRFECDCGESNSAFVARED